MNKTSVSYLKLKVMEKFVHTVKLQFVQTSDSIFGCFYQKPAQLSKVGIKCFILTSCVKVTQKLCECWSKLHVVLHF